MQVGCASENNPYLKSNSVVEIAPLGETRNCCPNRFRPLSPHSCSFTLQAKSKQAPIQPPMNDGNRQQPAAGIPFRGKEA